MNKKANNQSRMRVNSSLIMKKQHIALLSQQSLKQWVQENA